MDPGGAWGPVHPSTMVSGNQAVPQRSRLPRKLSPRWGRSTPFFFCVYSPLYIAFDMARSSRGLCPSPARRDGHGMASMSPGRMWYWPRRGPRGCPPGLSDLGIHSRRGSQVPGPSARTGPSCRRPEVSRPSSASESSSRPRRRAARLLRTRSADRRAASSPPSLHRH